MVEKKECTLFSQIPYLTYPIEATNMLDKIWNVRIVYTLLSGYKWKDSSKTKNKAKAENLGGNLAYSWGFLLNPRDSRSPMAAAQDSVNRRKSLVPPSSWESTQWMRNKSTTQKQTTRKPGLGLGRTGRKFLLKICNQKVEFECRLVCSQKNPR